MTKKTYAELMVQGSIFSDSQAQEVADRDPASLVPELPPYIFGFRYFDQVREQHTTSWGETKTDEGPREDVSGIYYPGGRVVTREDIESGPEFAGQDKSILRRNVSFRDFTHYVVTRIGTVVEFHLDRDQVIALPPLSAV